MPPETRLQKRHAGLGVPKPRAQRPHSADSIVLNAPPRVAETSSLASVALSADERGLVWDSINLDLRGDRPPTAAGFQSTMNPLDSLSRADSAVSQQSGTVSPRALPRSRIPTPTSRPNATSRHSGQGDASHHEGDWSRPPHLYVTEARLSQVASDLTDAMELGFTRTADALADRISSYVQAMERRVVEQVVDSVSAEYNSTAIKNIERNAAFRNELAKLTQTVHGNTERLAQTVERLDQAVDLSERASLTASGLNSRFGQWQSLDEAFNRVCADFESRLLSNSEAIRAEYQAEVHQVADSVRTLSLRLGSMSQPHCAHHSSIGRRGHDAPGSLTGDPLLIQNNAGVGLSAQTVGERDHVLPQAPPRNSGDIGAHELQQPPSVCPAQEGEGLRASRPPLRELPIPPAPSSRPIPNIVESPLHDEPRHGAGCRELFPSPPLYGRGGCLRSSSGSGTTAYALKLDRLKRKIRLTCNLLISTMSIDPTLVSTKAQAIEVVNYDLPQLLSLKATLRECEREWEKLDDLDEELGDLIDTTGQSALGWERALVDLQKKFYMHLRPNASLLKKVDLLPFTGSPDSETVFQFLETFHRLADMSCDPSEQADLLYNSYLSPEIQLEVFSFKTDIKRIETWLISQYGDLRRLADLRVARVASMKHPTSAQPPTAHIDYFKSVHQLLIHLESLSQCERVDQQEMSNIIFNASWVTQLVSRLPEESIVAFTKLLEKEPRIPPPSGKRHFELLRDLVDSTWRQLITAQRIRTARDPGGVTDSRRPPPSRTANNAGGSTPAVPQAPHSPKAAGKPGGKKAASSCPFHDPGVPARHSIGQCYSFFRATNQQRLELCKKAKACFSCLSTDCIRVSPGGCITSQRPAELTCGDCAQGKSRRPLNVLLCSNSAHSKPPLKTVQDALARYMKPFDLKLVDHLRPQFNLTSAAGRIHGMSSSASLGPSKSSPVDQSQKVPIFDTVTGSSGASPKTVREESSEDTIYVFQLIKIGGRNALVFYDSGATGNLVRGAFAEAAGFKVLDSSSQLVGALGNSTMWTKYGIYSAMLGDDSSGNYHHLLFQGIDQITTAFPRYDLRPMAKEARAAGRLDPNELFPQHVGGMPTDILIGLKSSELQPRLLFTLPSGLGVYRCCLRDCWGSNIAFGGPHKLISSINKKFYGFSVTHLSVLLTQLRPSILNAPWLSSNSSAPPASCPFVSP